MKDIIILSFKKICRTNQIVLAFLIVSYFSLLCIALYTEDLKSFVVNLNLVLSYGCLLLTGGQLRDEVNRGYLDVILHKIRRAKIVMGKFLSVIFFAFVGLILLFLSLSVLLFLKVNYEDFKSLFIIIVKGFVVIFYLISIGFFLSLYFKGYFNFVIVFFMEFAFLVLIDHFDILTKLDSSDGISNIPFLLISLLSPHLIYSRTNIIVLIGLIVFSILFIFSTIYIFEKIEFKRE